jgi:phosphate transport system substrate-binding protein
VLKIEGAELNDDTVRNKKWAYARPTYYYTNGEPAGEAKKFTDFTLSEDGQGIVRKVGFVPVK